MNIPNRVGQVWIQYETFKKEEISRIFLITERIPNTSCKWQIVLLSEIEFPSNIGYEVSSINEYFSRFEEWVTLERVT
jgi:hypothetical protein